MKGVMRVALVLALITVGFMVTASAAHAMIVYDLTNDHCTGGCGPAGTIFGTVTLIQNGTTVDITVHLNSDYAFAKTGSGDNQVFKFNASGVALGDITIDAQTPALAADTGAFNGGGTGAFNFGIVCATCGAGVSGGFTNDIVFHVANATIADLTVPNDLGNVFVADIGNLTTGATGPTAVTLPEPGTLMLLGTGLIVIGFAARRRRRWSGARETK